MKCSIAVAASAFFLTAGSFAQSVSLNVVQNLNFPTIAIPESETAELSVSPLNSSTMGTATILYGSASRGQFNLTADQNSSGISISVDIAGVSVSASNVTLGEFTGLYRGILVGTFPSQTLPLPDTAGVTPFYLGAKITATPGVQAGPMTATFTIRVTVL
jgi:hypothetical protein